MTGQELATAAQYDAGVSCCCSTTACTAPSACTRSASIPGRVLGSALANPDFARYCESFGGLGLRAESTAQVGAALDQALAFTQRERRPALLHMIVDPQAITPNLTLDQIRKAAAGR